MAPRLARQSSSSVGYLVSMVGVRSDGADAPRFQALEEWYRLARRTLVPSGFDLSLIGPLDDSGMEPRYFVPLLGADQEGEAVLFRGGELLLAVFEGTEPRNVQDWHVHCDSGQEIVDALDRWARVATRPR